MGDKLVLGSGVIVKMIDARNRLATDFGYIDPQFCRWTASQKAYDKILCTDEAFVARERKLRPPEDAILLMFGSPVMVDETLAGSVCEYDHGGKAKYTIDFSIEDATE